MINKKKSVKDIKNRILSYDCDFDYIYEELNNNFEFTISGVLNSLLYLFKNVDNTCNKETIDNIISLLNNFVKHNKNKKTMEKLHDKIQVFLGNISKSLDYLEIKKLEKYISEVIDIQNKCLSNPLKKNKSDKHNFMMYLIFERHDVELLNKYMLENMKEFLTSNSILPAVFMEVIERFTKLEEENRYEIKYYNQVINLFLKGKIYDKLLKKQDNEFMQILKSSDKDFVWDLIDKIEGKERNLKEISREYSVSFVFPSDLEKIIYTSRGHADFTNQNIITIDSEDDRCLDDALYIEKNSNGTYTFYIHLANPPSVIPYYSKTMREALRRSETIYLPDTEIPIYEDYLSNDMLSILPGKKTNTLTFIVDLDSDYTVLLDTLKVVPGVVVNKNKLSYDRVDEILTSEEDNPLYNDLLLLSRVIDKLSKDNLKISALHKIENIALGKTNTNSAKADVSLSHKMVENSMIFANRLPHILNEYNRLGMVFPYRVQPECNEEFIDAVLKNINTVDPSNGHFRKVVKNYFATSRYSHINIHHAELGLNGYVRVSSPARRALDAMVQYILYDLYINRNRGDLDSKYYFWESEVRYWCDYTNNRISENNIFIDEYCYLRSKGKILEKK